MLAVRTPIGTTLHVPERIEEDAPYFTADSLTDARDYYGQHGYVVLRGLIAPAACARARAAFDATVRPSVTPLLRQASMRYERHVLDTDGFLANAILNVQDLGTGPLGGFRNAALDILAHPATAAATAALLECAQTKLVQSRFFEAPAGTWAHQDSYYQDSATRLGGGVAGWFALEDIDAGAGRFYICPGSHRSLAPLRNEGPHNVATGHDAYRAAMLEAMRSQKLPIAAPFLAAGDVLFWNSLTVHGSLAASRTGVSRCSLTAHYLDATDAMLQFHSRIRAQRTLQYNGMTIGLLHDHDRMRNRVLRSLAFRLPGPYMAVQRLAMRAMLARHARRRAHAAPPPEGVVPVSEREKQSNS
jgi:phytanoyl-CoA hydroxylase